MGVGARYWGIWRQVRFAIAIPLLCPVAVAAQDRPTLQARVATTLRDAGPGTRFGLVVLDDRGAEIVAIAPDDRFVPASTTKIVTTAAVFATMGDLSAPDTAAGATVGIVDGDVVLTGHGDARLSSAADCVRDCLATLADAIAGATRTVRDVIGDDSLYPDRRWSPGMGWNNLATRSGTAVSALTLDDNVLRLVVTADGHGGARIAALPYFTIDAHIVAGARTEIGIDRQPGSRILRVEGTIAPDAPPQILYASIDDPADYAAWRLRTMLLARNVRVTGMVRTRHQPAAKTAPPPLTRAEPTPLGEDPMLTNKTSQNLHAELLLRRLDAAAGGTAVDGASAVTAMLTRAGVERWRYDFADGSGMSTYNRVSPRGIARFLRWTQTQPWGANWRATLPIGGIDGTLSRRFVGTPLAGRLWAKTGTLNGASALAGFLTARSGRELSFALYANDMPEGAAVTKAMDAALLLIAAEN